MSARLCCLFIEAKCFARVALGSLQLDCFSSPPKMKFSKARKAYSPSIQAKCISLGTRCLLALDSRNENYTWHTG